MIGEFHLNERTPRTERSTIGDGGVQSVDGHVRDWDPVFNQFPRRILESELLSIQQKIRFESGRATVTIHLQQTTIPHRKNVEVHQGAIGCADRR